MLKQSKPSVWNVYEPNNADLEMETGFEEFMFLVAEHAPPSEDLNKITVFRFYSLLNHIKKKTKDG